MFSPSIVDVNLDVARRGMPVRFLELVTEAQQKCRPLRAAVVHELDGFFPVRVPEEHERLIVAPFEIEIDFGASPLWRAVDAAPAHALPRRRVEHLHRAEAEVDGAAGVRIA